MRITATFFLVGVSLPALARDAPPALNLPINQQVTQKNISKTICQIGWTMQVRPPYGYTHEVKLRKLRAKRLPASASDRFELDHLIPLDLGGDPYSENNMALEPWPEARRKDVVEYCLALQVCIGAVKLAVAQQAIWDDWRRAGTLCER